jgi:predicted RNase H-like HicB family nuclease
MTREYLVVYEKSKANWSAYSPDIPGCGSLGDTLDETRANLREAIVLYLTEAMKAGEPIPRSEKRSVHFPRPEEGHGIEYWVIERLKTEDPHKDLNG